jgi:RimJ/RimL family protein N-acetyltransferase
MANSASPTSPIERPPRGRPPSRSTFEGRFATVEPLDPVRHGAELFAAARDPGIWDWLAYGPFADDAAMRLWLEQRAASADPIFFAIRDRTDGLAKGMCAWLRLDPPNGVIEIGHIWLSPGLQRTREATDALFVMMHHALDELGYRRLEWKCDALNAPSRRAALRLGFIFEGIFRQHMVVKGRNRDTAWYAIIDTEWPRLRAAFQAWLDDGNFDPQGRQHKTLAAFMDRPHGR